MLWADGKLSPVQVAGIMGPLAPFLREPPNRAEVLALIVETWRRAEENPGQEDVARVVAAVRWLSGHERLLVQAATWCVEVRAFAEARELAALGLAAAKTEQTRKTFQDLSGRLAAERAP